MPMQLILKEDVPNLGKSGEMVNVKPGYGRNYLIPHGLAVVATEKNVARVEHEKRLIAARNLKLMKDAQSIADRLGTVELVIQRQAGPASGASQSKDGPLQEDKLFGSVSTRDVEEALADQGIRLDRRKIVLAEPIRTLGVYTLDVKLAPDVVAKLKVWVVAKK